MAKGKTLRLYLSTGSIPFLATMIACGPDLSDGEDAIAIGQTGAALYTYGGELVQPATESAFSGRSGSRTVELARWHGHDEPLYALTYGESWNDPCYLRAFFRDLRDGSTFDKRYDECSGSAGNFAWVALPEHFLATGIRVCLDSSRTKVKGIALTGKRDVCINNPNATYQVDPCSPIFSVNGIENTLCRLGVTSITRQCSGLDFSWTEYHERPNCPGSDQGPDADWELRRDCPAGYVANGIILHERDGGGQREMFDGLKLKCHRLID